MVLGISLNEMITRIGHDGSEIVFPHLLEPQRRRCFHIQEMIAVSFSLKRPTTEFQFNPCMTPNGVDIFEVPASGIQELMSVSIGVLLGKGRVHGHAVAWNGTHIYDPLGMVYDIENQELFAPYSFFAISNQNGL